MTQQQKPPPVAAGSRTPNNNNERGGGGGYYYGSLQQALLLPTIRAKNTKKAGRRHHLWSSLSLWCGCVGGILVCCLVALILPWHVPSPATNVIATTQTPKDDDSSSSPPHQSSHSWSREHFGMKSAFEDDLYSGNYHSHHNSASFTSNNCQAKRLHWTQAGNVGVSMEEKEEHEDSYKVNMTLSFTIDRNCCRSSTTLRRVRLPPSNKNINQTIHTITIYYRLLQNDDNHKEEETEPQLWSSLLVTEPPIQFQYNASLAVPGLDHLFISDEIYHVTLPNLVAGRQWYEYYIDVVTSTSQPTSSASTTTPTSTIVTPPAPPLPSTTTNTTKTTPTILALVGDLGQTENSTLTMRHIYEQVVKGTANHDGGVTGLVIAGDLSYADGDPYRWTRWLELMEPLLKRIPLFSVPGNHEIECDASTAMVFEQYEAYFRNPNRDPRPVDIQPIPKDYADSLWSCLTASEFLGHYNRGNAYWQVRHGLVHLIGLNSYTSILPDSPQYQWFEAQLQYQVNRQITPWVIVVFHCPLHTSFIGHDGEINPHLMLTSIEPLLVHYQVNLVLSGHDHAYLRTHPLVGTKPPFTIDPQKGVVYWTLGAGGNREQHNKGYLHEIPESWVAQRELSEYGYGQFWAANATHARLTWMRDGTTREGITDDVWITNHYTYGRAEVLTPVVANPPQEEEY